MSELNEIGLRDNTEIVVRTLNLIDAKTMHLHAEVVCDHKYLYFFKTPIPIISDNVNNPQRIGFAVAYCDRVWPLKADLFLQWDTTERFELEQGTEYWVRPRITAHDEMLRLRTIDALILTTESACGHSPISMGPL